MTEEEIKLLKQQYLFDSNISTTDELVDEAIATLESYFELMNQDDLHKNARLIVLPYLALIAVKKDKAMTWISVKDRLPDDHERVLVRLRGDGYTAEKIRIEIATFTLGDFFLYYKYRDGMTNDLFTIPYCVDSVTHWMPIPEPPKETEL